MDLFYIILLAVALSMDTFSVSITRGLVWNCNLKHSAIIAVFWRISGTYASYRVVYGY